ncbi:MAG: sugar-binding transcriptional regulator [candidate division NC10 bacterium]|nr:sugar-binding transcriptional regulator [candidate division NC10 bacterium]MBI2455917.1 sugar-binding transcriptional regulator [candidate division NC10 bacterium]
MFNPPTAPDTLALMVRVSRMYYEQGLTQQQIARATRLSRPTISRLLDRARRAGIVEIRILDPVQDAESLAAALTRRFGLREVVLAGAAPGTGGDPRQQVGRLVAEYLQRLLRDGMTLGVSWGKTLREMALALKPAHLANLTVVQMMGSLTVLADSVETTGLAQEVGRILGSKTVQFLAPALVEDLELRRRILSTPEVRQAMEYLHRLDAAMVGIGAISPHVPLVERGYFTAAAMERYRRLGARGEMLLQFFDAHGRPIPELNRRVVGMSLSDLARVPLVIAGVSGPPDKSEAILAALRGKVLHVLITDTETARRVLERADEDEPATRRAARTSRGPHGRPARKRTTRAQ